ncbi:hypothetical protein D3C72_1732240 [compost metagenome]
MVQRPIAQQFTQVARLTQAHAHFGQQFVEHFRAPADQFERVCQVLYLELVTVGQATVPQGGDEFDIFTPQQRKRRDAGTKEWLLALEYQVGQLVATRAREHQAQTVRTVATVKVVTRGFQREHRIEAIFAVKGVLSLVDDQHYQLP